MHTHTHTHTHTRTTPDTPCAVASCRRNARKEYGCKESDTIGATAQCGKPVLSERSVLLEFGSRYIRCVGKNAHTRKNVLLNRASVTR